MTIALERASKGNKMKVLFVGYGKMGSALGESWLQSGLISKLTAVDPGQATDVQAEVLKSLDELTEFDYDLVVAAVKPALASAALAAIPEQIWGSATLVSIMAGVSSSSLYLAIGGQAQVVRAMPNTAVSVNEGCTGLFSALPLALSAQDKITSLFSTVGKAFWVNSEELLHSVTAISGSGPAYYHLFSEALAVAGEALGLPTNIARELAAHTALGAAQLQVKFEFAFSDLREAVTSPNGTTAAAINIFERNEALRCLVMKATEAAHTRSIELAADS